MKKKRYIPLFSVILCLLLMTSLLAGSVYGGQQEIPEQRQLSRLVDDADLLTSREERELEELLDEISERQQCDVAVVTVNSLKGKSAEAYADDFYDYNGYGMGTGDDGILLLVAMESRDWHITTYHFGAKALTDAGISYISERFLPDLSDGDYANAFEIYAKLCDEFITQAKTGKAYDRGNMPKEKLSLVWIPIALGIGLVLALIITGLMRMQLKSVRRQAMADGYMRPGSRELRVSRDIFLYRNVIRRERPRDNGSGGGGGGSSMHTSSSGRSHGGGGGKF